MKQPEAEMKNYAQADKANVLESSRLWREVVQDVAKQMRVETTHMFADALAMQIIKNRGNLM